MTRISHHLNCKFCSNDCTQAILPGYPRYKYHSFIAGAVGGYFVWGKEYSSVHYQILLYLASRVLVGCIKVALGQQNHNDAMQVRSNNSIYKEAPNNDNHSNDRVVSSESNSSTTCYYLKKFVEEKGYSLSSTIVWALVMSLFENYPNSLHPSLRSSMEEIYHSSPASLLSNFCRLFY